MIPKMNPLKRGPGHFAGLFKKNHWKGKTFENVRMARSETPITQHSPKYTIVRKLIERQENICIHFET